jgi:hypothetical protein
MTETAVPSPPAAPPAVIRDVFPAEVVYDGQILRSARAVITADLRLLVWLRPGEPVIDVALDPDLSVIAALNAPRSRASHLTTTDGKPAHVNGQRGCGCGNPLKGWTPWQPYRKQAA